MIYAADFVGLDCRIHSPYICADKVFMSVIIEYLPPMYQVLCLCLPHRYLQSLEFHQMVLPPPTGVYYVYFQPNKIKYYLTFDRNSVLTVDILSPGSQSQQWQISVGLDTASRTLRNI